MPEPIVCEPVHDVVVFYDALAPHGAWIVVDGVRVWRPAVAVAVSGWRPYCDEGYWVHTDLGWSWHSDYVWGWAPFHYGRWAHYPSHGWVWYPGNEWAPAWVDWRVCDDHYGWAPLPPCATHDLVLLPSYDPRIADATYVFVRREHVLDRHVSARCLPRATSATVYSRTTRVAGNYALRDGRVSHRGPDRGAVDSRQATSVRRPVAAPVAREPVRTVEAPRARETARSAETPRTTQGSRWSRRHERGRPSGPSRRHGPERRSGRSSRPEPEAHGPKRRSRRSGREARARRETPAPRPGR